MKYGEERSIAYQSFEDVRADGYEQCNRESDAIPLCVNCAGRFVQDTAFVTDRPRGRRDFYLLCVIEGELTAYDGMRAIPLKGGDFLLYYPNSRYAYTYAGGEPLVYGWVHFTGSDALARLTEYGLAPFPSVHHAPAGRTEERFADLFSAFSPKDAYRDRALAASLELLLLTLARAKSTEGGSRLRRSVEYMQEHFTSAIRIPELSKMEHLSPSRYHDLFVEQMHTTPTRYLLALRMEQAKRLLRDSRLPVAEVARLCGYEDGRFFIKRFSLYAGCTPGEYRRRSDG